MACNPNHGPAVSPSATGKQLSYYQRKKKHSATQCSHKNSKAQSKRASSVAGSAPASLPTKKKPGKKPVPGQAPVPAVVEPKACPNPAPVTPQEPQAACTGNLPEGPKVPEPDAADVPQNPVQTPVPPGGDGDKPPGDGGRKPARGGAGKAGEGGKKPKRDDEPEEGKKPKIFDSDPLVDPPEVNSTSVPVVSQIYKYLYETTKAEREYLNTWRYFFSELLGRSTRNPYGLLIMASPTPLILAYQALFGPIKPTVLKIYGVSAFASTTVHLGYYVYLLSAKHYPYPLMPVDKPLDLTSVRELAKEIYELKDVVKPTPKYGLNFIPEWIDAKRHNLRLDHLRRIHHVHMRTNRLFQRATLIPGSVRPIVHLDKILACKPVDNFHCSTHDMASIQRMCSGVDPAVVELLHGYTEDPSKPNSGQVYVSGMQEVSESRHNQDHRPHTLRGQAVAGASIEKTMRYTKRHFTQRGVGRTHCYEFDEFHYVHEILVEHTTYLDKGRQGGNEDLGVQQARANALVRNMSTDRTTNRSCASYTCDGLHLWADMIVAASTTGRKNADSFLV